MSGRLDGKVAIITGGASGMGRDTALRFLAEGCSVVIGDMNEANGAQTIKLAEEQGTADGLRFCRTDVAEEGDVVALIDAAVTAFGRLDCIFNNAGIGGAFGPITETEVEECREPPPERLREEDRDLRLLRGCGVAVLRREEVPHAVREADGAGATTPPLAVGAKYLEAIEI